jgi:hypothetical protein
MYYSQLLKRLIGIIMAVVDARREKMSKRILGLKTPKQ